MSLSPNKSTLSRQPSSPSLAVGLPPALPESNIMAPSTTSPSKLPKSRSKNRIHRGDVESTESSDSEEIPRNHAGTPKRKVINTGPVSMSSNNKAKKRETLAERLAAAAAGNVNAKVKNSSSVNDGLKASNSTSALTTASASTSAIAQTPPAQARTTMLIPSTMPVQRTSRPSSGSTSSDKVVVCVRIKPTQSSFSSMAYEITSTSLTLSDNHPKVKQRGGKAGREDTYTYTFDKLLEYPSTTPELYVDKVAPLIDKAMNGFNSTVFAYGQTGSGKSFTMTGIPTELGIIPCAVDGVFDAITEEPERAFLLRVSYIEIYNETLRDLLNFKKGPLRDYEKPSIHTSKGKVYVEPLVEEIVSTPEDVMELLEKGNAQRRIGATDWNERSSRSHCVFTIVIESRPRDGDGDEDIRLSRLNLIDLAGSEKAVSDSERRGEGKHINQSLLALREVINKLTEKAKASHIPYRNSKLTHLLENALGGDSNICVICTLSAEEEHCGETLETLKFAGRCSQVKTNAKKNILPASERALIRAKDQEIEELRARLMGLTNSRSSKMEPDTDQVTDLAESVAAMEARKAKLTAQLAKLNSEILTSELPRHPSTIMGTPMSPPKPKRRRISDFSAIMSVGSDRIGLGMGTPKKVDRRAVSGLTRVQEEEDAPGTIGRLSAGGNNGAPNFDHDIALATLRKSLTQKEEELSLANRNLASALSRASQLSKRDERIAALTTELSTALKSLCALRATLQPTETDLRDRDSQLEATRADLAATMEDKTTKIDELEGEVLELRKSREELVIEDEGRLQEVQMLLDMAVKDKQGIEQRVKLREDEGAARKKAEEGEKAAKKEVESIKSQLEVLQKEHAAIYSSAQNASTKFAEYESFISTLTAQTNDLLSAKLSRETALEQLRSEHAETKKQRDQAAEDLESFQKEAMANETKILGELREEIGNLRRLREDEKAVWDRSKAEMEASIDSLKQGEVKSKAQLVEALKTLEDAAQANRSLEKKLSCEAEGRRTAQEERDQALERAKEAAGGAHAQLEQEIATRHELTAQLASLREQLDSQGAVIETLTRDLNTERQSAKELARQLDMTQKEIETQEARIEKAVDERKDFERRLSEMENALEAGEKEWKARVDDEAHKKREAEEKLNELEKMRKVGTSAEKELQMKLDVEAKARDELEQRLKGAQEKHSSFKALENDLRKQLDAQATSRESAESKLQEITSLWESESADLRQQLQTAVSRCQKVEEDFTALQHQHDTTTTSDAELRKKLEVESTARKVAEKKIIQLDRQRETSSSEEANLQKKLDDEQRAKEELQRKLQDMEGRLQNEMEELQVKAEAEFKHRQEAERKFIELTEKQGISEAANQDMQNRLKAEIAAQQTANDKVSALKEKLEAAASTEQRLRQRLSEESVSQAQIREQLEAAVLAEQRSRQLLEAESASRQAAERKLDEVFASSKIDSEKHKNLEAELAKHRAANQKLASLEAAHTELQTQFKALKSASEAAQKDSQAEYSKEVNALRKELVILQESLSKAKAEAGDAKIEADAHRQKSIKLARDVVELEARDKDNKTLSSSTSVSARLRTLSTPGPWANGGGMSDASVKGMKARELKGTTAGFGAGERDSSMARLHVGHEDEIERLEKVVEVQKGIIDEQRMKIERWSKEMEKQREIVRLLTNDTTSTPLSASPLPPNRFRGKSHSISHSPTESPAIATPAKGFPSTFTARNLALPTTPTPLPMHPTQFSNASVRKGRRVTIEHDIDLLTESNKVNRAKAMFETPDKGSKQGPATPTREPLRANQATWSIPRQRRP
ncbi:centromeric protein E [Cryptococcus neoformans c45]|nr:centromeric protein E [Cryptococcus neoformans var. grubii c45]